MSDNSKIKKSLREYIEFFETLSPRSIPLIEKVAESDIHFKDPFNDVRGTDQVQSIFKKMYEDMDDPKFKVIDYGLGQEPNKAYLRWVFWGKGKNKNNRLEIHGMSEVTFSPGGKVIEHIDHWDASEQFYAHIPIIGSLIKFVQSKLKI